MTGNKWYILILFLFGLTTIQAQNTSSTQTITLRDAFAKLDSIHSVSFAYSDLPLDEKVNCDFTIGLDAALVQLSNQVDFSFKTIGNQIVIRSNPRVGTIAGRVVDADSKQPLLGSSITLSSGNLFHGGVSNEYGYFRIENIPIGRHNITISYLGYEPVEIYQVAISSGKESFMEIPLKEALVSLEEIVVLEDKYSQLPVNDMANGNGRSFSTEEAQRYAMSIGDPARMVQVFAGVTSGSDDLSNEIIIRGNSSRSLLWQLEGIPIPNPNHFTGIGSGGGAISMLSSNTLSTSDFYTGAFPAQFGNALSGVFDLRLRNGNHRKREHTFAIGNLGLEAASEGYFKKGHRASYLIQYRYSTTALLEKYLPSLNDSKPRFQDFSSKINLPTKRFGTLSFFAMGGKNKDSRITIRDTTKWIDFDDQLDQFENQKMLVLGLSHNFFLSDQTYVKTTIGRSAYVFRDLTHFIIARNNYEELTVDQSDFKDIDWLLSTYLHWKINEKQNVRIGVLVDKKVYNYDYFTIDPEKDVFIKFVEDKGESILYQTYIQWKRRLGQKWTTQIGLNWTHFGLNATNSISPRLSLNWTFIPNHQFTYAFGLHSKIEHTSTYLIERNIIDDKLGPNFELPHERAIHNVASYSFRWDPSWLLKIEAYHQYLYKIPVSANPQSSFSVLNTYDVFDIIFDNDSVGGQLTAVGKGWNKGLELTLNKQLYNNTYLLLTASFYDSRFSDVLDRRFHTRFDNNFTFNGVFGKEWNFGVKQSQTFGFNARFTYYDGSRETPINLDASLLNNQQIFLPNRWFEEKLPPYVRFDLGIEYRINAEKTTHTIRLDMQNIFNRFNAQDRFYSSLTRSIITTTQNGFIPFLQYKIQFGSNDK